MLLHMSIGTRSRMPTVIILGICRGNITQSHTPPPKKMLNDIVCAWYMQQPPVCLCVGLTVADLVLWPVGLKYAKNALVAGTLPRTPLGSSRRSPDSIVGWGGGCPRGIPPPQSQHPWASSTPSFSSLRRSASVPPKCKILATPLDSRRLSTIMEAENIFLQLNLSDLLHSDFKENAYIKRRKRPTLHSLTDHEY